MRRDQVALNAGLSPVLLVCYHENHEFFPNSFPVCGRSVPDGPNARQDAGQPPAPATPVAGSTPATPTPGTPTVTGPDGVTMPLNISPAPVIPPDRVVIQVGDIKLTAAQMDEILQAYPENQRMFINGPGRSQFIDQVVRVLLLSEEGRRRKLTETEAYKTQLMFSTAGILATHTDEDIKREVRGNETLLKAYYEAHKSDYEQIRARHILIRMQGAPMPLAAGQKDLTEAEALAKAQEIRQKIVQGADFADLARAESSDTGTAVQRRRSRLPQARAGCAFFRGRALHAARGRSQPARKNHLRLSHHQSGREEAHQDLRGSAPRVGKESGK